jgi:iron complex transport system substrate-binding protein
MTGDPERAAPRGTSGDAERAAPRGRSVGRPFQGRLVLLAIITCVISLHAQARRIISIIPATTEMLFAMGAGDRVIAIGSYDHFPPESQKLPKVGALIDPNVEQILQMRPDLVVAYGTQTELKRRLDRAHIPYFDYLNKGLADIADTMRALGARIGAQAAGSALAARFEAELADVRRRVGNAPRPKTLLIFERERRSLRNMFASGGEGFLHDMIGVAGGANVFADVHRQSVMMSTEMVLDRAPEVIIELRYSADDIDDADINAWNTLSTVPAVKNHRIVVLTGEEFVVPGPRVGAATRKLAAALHPELRW